MLALDRSGIILTSIFEFCFAFVSFSDFLRRAPVVLRIRVQRLDELHLNAGLALPVVVGDVVGPIAPVTVDLARIELTSSACEL